MKERAYKYRFYPTPEQAELLAQTFGCVRVVYNKVLGWCTNAFNQDKTNIGYSKASAYLTKLKKETDYAWLNAVSCVPLQQCLRHKRPLRTFLMVEQNTQLSRKSAPSNLLS